MESAATLGEVHRILKDVGVFAAIDYDWPPVSDWRIEACYDELRQLLDRVFGTARFKAGFCYRMRIAVK